MSREPNMASDYSMNDTSKSIHQVPQRLLRHLRLFTDLDIRLYLTLLSLAESQPRLETSIQALASRLALTTPLVRRSLFRLVAFGIVRSTSPDADADRKVIELLPDRPRTLQRTDGRGDSPAKIAEALEDQDNLSTYEHLCETVPKDIIRRALDETLAVPAEQIRKSRAALFIHLVRKYAKP